MARMATKKKGNNTRKGTGLEAQAIYPGVDMVEGSVINYDKSGVNFEYFRYGSRYRQFFPARRIITCLGTTGSKECMLWYSTAAKSLWDRGKRDRAIPISEPEVYGDHLIKSSSPDFGIILLNPEFTTIVGKSTGETGRGRGRKPKPGKENVEAPQRDPRIKVKGRKSERGEKKVGDWD